MAKTFVFGEPDGLGCAEDSHISHGKTDRCAPKRMFMMHYYGEYRD